MEQIDRNLLAEEIYHIPRLDGTLVYAPLTRSFLFTEEKKDQLELPDEWVDEATSPHNVPQFVIDSLSGVADNTIRLRFNVTDGCNLSCDYCSVGAKRLNKSVLDRNLAKGIIHHFLEECSRSAKKLELTVSGGEPTTVPGLLAWLMSFTREEAEIRKIQCSSKILTNGVYNRSAEKIIIGNFDSVQISWDGDYPNNPRYGKKLKQAGVVRTNIGRLVEAGIPVSLLTVVSEHNQTELEKLADDVYQNMQADSLFLSLKDSVGRALNHQKPDYNLIGDKYFRLWKKYRVLGYDINLTGTNVHAISKYPCAVAAPNFSVSPTGRISACTIAFNDASAKSEPFGIGGAGDGIRLDQEKIGKLQIYSVEHRSGCKNCHAKWHCRGGCPYAFENGMAAGDPERCDLVRKVIADKLMWIIENE